MLLYFTRQGAQFGDEVLAANAILMQLVHLASYSLDGLAHATESLVGNARGGRDLDRQRRILRISLCWSTLVATGMALTFWFGQVFFVHLLSDLPLVIATTQRYYFWAACLPVVAVGAYVLDGYCIGSGQTRAMRDTLLLSALLIFFPCWWLAEPLGNHGLWLASLILRGGSVSGLGCRSVHAMKM